MTIKQSEIDFQQQIIDLAHTYGWIVAHFRPGRTEKGWRTPVSADGKGFPDLVFLHPVKHRFFMAEIKSEKGKVSIHQMMWIDALWKAGIGTYTWRPSDWEWIVQILLAGEVR